MRVFRFLSVILTLGWASGQVPRTTSASNPVIVSTRFQFIASIESASVKLGAPITLRFRLINTSATRVSVVYSEPEYDIEVFVADASGREMTRTAHGRLLFQGGGDRRAIVTDLDPGQEFEESLEISTIYELKQPGVYYIQALRPFLGSNPSIPHPVVHNAREAAQIPVEKAVSNKVQFTITP